MLSGVRLALLSILVGLIIWGILSIFTDRITAAQLASIPMLLFWFVDLASMEIVLILLIIIQFAIGWLSTKAMTTWMNWTSALALGSAISIILIVGIPRDLIHTRTHGTPESMAPDIYLITLDSYGGRSILLERFHYDNQPFLDQLSGMGFHVSECEQPGAATELSLGATLNHSDTSGSIRSSLVRSELEKRGYMIVAFSTGFVWTEIRDADLYLEPKLPPSELSEFEAAMLAHTPLARFIDYDAIYGDRYRERTAFALDRLPSLAMMPMAKFVFAHLIIPHPPFVFNADGSRRDWSQLRFPAYDGNAGSTPEYSAEAYADGYIAQLRYVDRAIIPVLKRLINSSVRPLIIMLQGDHGPWYAENDKNARMALCAVYSPDIDLPVRAVDAFDALLSPTK